MNTAAKLTCRNIRLCWHSSSRSISKTANNCSKKSFNKFTLIYRGTEYEKKQQRENPDRNIPFWSHGLRYPGYFVGNRFVPIPEMIPDLIVPDLTNCDFKPYVSYRTSIITQTEFTAEDLFDSVYIAKIENDFRNDKLDENGISVEPSENENMTAEEAYVKARQTGSDYFCHDKPPSRAERLNID